MWSWLSLAKASNKKTLDSKETSPCSLSPAWDTSTPATHQSRSERNGENLRKPKIGVRRTSPSETNRFGGGGGGSCPGLRPICATPGWSWPTLNKEGAFEGSKSSALEDGSLGEDFCPKVGFRLSHAGLFPSRVVARHVSQASGEGDRGRLASFSGLACWKLVNPSEMGFVGASSYGST